MIPSIALFLPAVLPVDPLQADGSLVAYSKRVGDQLTAYVEVQGPAGAPYVLLAQPTGQAFDYSTGFQFADGYLGGAGTASVAVGVPNAAGLPAGTCFQVAAVYLDEGQFWQTDAALLPIGGAQNALALDFDFAPGFQEPVPGQEITDEYVDIGLRISALNKGGGPNRALIFDSANPTGGDTDLLTPGPGLGNDVAYGQLLIVAENDVDADNDGLVDDPDDEQGGGILRFTYDPPADVFWLTVVDIDDTQFSEIRFTREGVPGVTTVPLVDVGDNGVQTVFVQFKDVTNIALDFGGSGGIAEIGMIPCPITADFNESTMGRPLDMPAGTEMTDQYYDELGLRISAENGSPFGPDKAIIFDSGNPTGGDFDLMTPGPGIGNDEFLGNLLIIAEDDVDADNDGLVDDPDDAQEGGKIEFRWDQDVSVLSFQVIDVDSEEFDFLYLYDEFDNLLLVRDLGPIGDNSVQMFGFDNGGFGGVRRAVLEFAGSGGVDNFRWCLDDEGGEPAL
ncbi:hypothetical protein [Engelhardtia mirabilis]|uniref:Uncharacterized protein n=1 Tax=Engelhardtia mirabilis TaxID=2528011 RepID=A0A518BS71_9BACT|nr:hypothetical protein Pla133_49450 [Planctomycetes bacterium Pla133]QDV04149.1 hypothetical protein Pla86_49430 [Planctomycetes bacterium Pla86]